MYAARRCSSECSNGKGGVERREKGSQGGPREDKGRSRSKNSIISADARTSLGFPGADNGALFEESFCARPRYPGILFFFLLPLLLRIHFFSHAHATPVLFFSFATFHSFCRIKIQSCSQTKEDRHCGVGNDGRKGLRCAHEGVIERERETECVRPRARNNTRNFS